jgi:hypothetical protein
MSINKRSRVDAFRSSRLALQAKVEVVQVLFLMCDPIARCEVFGFLVVTRVGTCCEYGTLSLLSPLFMNFFQLENSGSFRTLGLNEKTAQRVNIFRTCC